jgi:phenylacetate-CoA ligase
MTDILELKHTIDAEMFSVLGIRVKVTVVEPGTVPRSEGKAKRIIDRRLV